MIIFEQKNLANSDIHYIEISREMLDSKVSYLYQGVGHVFMCDHEDDILNAVRSFLTENEYNSINAIMTIISAVLIRFDKVELSFNNETKTFERLNVENPRRSYFNALQ